MNIKTLVRLSMMLALAVVLGIVEGSLPPLPIPGVKLGLANIVNVVILYTSGFFESLSIGILRVLLVSVFYGNLFSITFYISLSGAIASVIGMYLVYILFRKDISVISVSSFGAFIHILAQLLTVSALMSTRDVLYLFPVLGILGVMTGIITGVISSHILRLKL